MSDFLKDSANVVGTVVILSILVITAYVLGNLTSNKEEQGYIQGYEKCMNDFNITKK